MQLRLCKTDLNTIELLLLPLRTILNACKYRTVKLVFAHVKLNMS